MIGLAVMAWLTVLICYGGNWVLGQCMIERPLVVGLVAGLLMGDVKTGVIIGASLEAIFMGAVNIGGAISAEPVTATALAVAFTVGAGIDQGAAITLAVPVGVVTAFLSIFMNNVFLAFFAATFDKMAAEGNEKGLALQHFVLWFVKYAAFGLIAFLGVYLGAEPVAAIVNQIPANVMSGLNAVGALLPAVGMALLLQMLWSTELSIYFFLGFTLYQYLGLPMIAIAVLGVIIAVASALRDKEIFDLTKKGMATQAVSSDSVTSDEEDFSVFASCAGGSVKAGADGWLYSVQPALNRYYSDDPEARADAMKRHTTWYNITQNVGTFAMGLVASMERENSQHEDFDTESIDGIKVSLMGPMSGIGDAIFWGVLRVIAAGIGINLAMSGSPLGAIMFLLIYNIPSILCRYFMTYLGFSMGTNFISEMYEGGLMKLITKATSTVGLVMIGAMTAANVQFNTILSIPVQDSDPVMIQTYLDSIFKGIVPLGLTLVVLWLLRKKNVNVNIILVGIMILALVLGLVGIV